LIENGLQRFQCKACSYHWGAIGEVVAAAVGRPVRIQTEVRVLPGRVITACRLHRPYRRPGTELAYHDRRAVELQRGADPAAVIESIKLVRNLDQAGRSIGLNQRLGGPDHPVAIQVLIENLSSDSNA
jgi:hypothetical protein